MDKPKAIGNYLIGKTIGQGTFGKVKLGTHTLTEEKVAVKILEKDKIKDVSDVERVAREIHILKLIRHPNIIQLYEIIETPKRLFLIMEYASGGELFDYIVSKSRLSELESCEFYQQIISGIEYIHRLGVVHRDLKPENLLLDDKKNIKIVDFGLSNTYRQDEMLQTACGSPCYAAPEMIAGNKYTGSRVDIWSTGVVLFAMLSGYLPFEDSKTAELYKKILNCQYEIPDWFSDLTKDFLNKVLNTDPEQRFNISQIREHPWYKQVKTVKYEGIVVGYSAIPINKEVLKHLENFGIDPEHCQKCLEANKHNDVTTTYYLLIKKLQASEGVAQTPSGKLPHPPIFPFEPIMNNDFKPILRHRKYVEKKKNEEISRDKSVRIRSVKIKGFISGKGIKDITLNGRNSTGKNKMKTQNIKSFKGSSGKIMNKSFDEKKSFLSSTIKKSPKLISRSILVSKLKKFG